MKKIFLFVLLLSVRLSIIYSQDIKIAVISDIHYLSSQLVSKGEALARYEESTGRNVMVNHEVLDKTLAEIKDQNVDVLLITGDLTNRGEKQSHIELIEKLNPLKQHGIRIMIIPGNHDINTSNSKSYIGDRAENVSSVSPQEFIDLYKSFGYDQSVMRDKNSLSYVAELDETTWLLALDTNLYDEYKSGYTSAGRIDAETMKWVLNVLDEAQKRGITVVGMMHHGLVEHLPYQSTFFADYLIEDWQNRAQQLADAGLKVMLTGHFHANDITVYTSSSGNRIYDIETGSLAQYPFPYRILKLNDGVLSVDTYKIESVPSEPQLQKKYLSMHEALARRAVSNRLKKIGMPLSQESMSALIDLLTRMSVLHAAGDEKISEDTYSIIERFAKVMDDDDFDASSFSIDFPPSDNKLTINLK